jgi:hypothetical protein
VSGAFLSSSFLPSSFLPSDFLPSDFLPSGVPPSNGFVLASAIDVGKLADVVVAALLAGVGVTVLFSLAILGLTRVSDTRRDGNATALAAYACLGLLSLAGCVAAVIYGLVLLTS